MFNSTTGNLVDRVTQRWVQYTGRSIDLRTHPWLDGPIGKPEGIGKQYFHDLAAEHGWELRRSCPNTGLLPAFNALRGPSFNPESVDGSVIEFYEKTCNYDLDAWAEWCGLFRPFGSLLALFFSRRLQQLNVPLNALDTSRGLTSEILQLVDRNTGEIRLTAWLRQLVGSGDVLYAGAYSTCRVPKYDGTCVKVVFPLPNGNAIVIMRPVSHPDGSFSVVSSGSGFGDAGFYFTVHSSRGIRARYLKSLRESIHVYRAENDMVRADHVLTLWGATFLRLHYRLQPRRAGSEPVGSAAPGAPHIA
jgi:hypothetical protein